LRATKATLIAMSMYWSRLQPASDSIY
jgi:hypothetical protein